MPKDTEDFSARAMPAVRDVVSYHRHHGAKITDAFAAAAEELSVSRWRVCTLWYSDKMFRMAAAEYHRLMAGWDGHLIRRMTDLDRQADAIQAQRIALRISMLDDQQTVTVCGKSIPAPSGQRSRDQSH